MSVMGNEQDWRDRRGWPAPLGAGEAWAWLAAMGVSAAVVIWALWGLVRCVWQGVWHGLGGPG
jgi:hypothetical protein